VSAHAALYRVGRIRRIVFVTRDRRRSSGPLPRSPSGGECFGSFGAGAVQIDEPVVLRLGATLSASSGVMQVSNSKFALTHVSRLRGGLVTPTTTRAWTVEPIHGNPRFYLSLPPLRSIWQTELHEQGSVKRINAPRLQATTDATREPPEPPARRRANRIERLPLPCRQRSETMTSKSRPSCFRTDRSRFPSFSSRPTWRAEEQPRRRATSAISVSVRVGGGIKSAKRLVRLLFAWCTSPGADRSTDVFLETIRPRICGVRERRARAQPFLAAARGTEHHGPLEMNCNASRS
jgi:hypothetical protein